MSKRPLRILLVEPFFAGSHRSWAESLFQHSSHQIHLLTLPGRYWKWRMHGGAWTLAQKASELAQKKAFEGREAPDLILATSMLDLTTFLAETRSFFSNTPCALYFHENQITYPWSKDDPDRQNGRDQHYGFIQLASARAADWVFFNSEFHQKEFLAAGKQVLGKMRDFSEVQTIQMIQQKSSVLPLGLELKDLVEGVEVSDSGWIRSSRKVPTFLWNHRWEYDKDPKTFLQNLLTLSQEGFDFRLVLLGESYRKVSSEVQSLKERLTPHIEYEGFAPDEASYRQIFRNCDFYYCTSIQDFFGASVVEAVAAGLTPLLPQRLAYPEHQIESEFFYSEEGQVLERLREMLTLFPKRKRSLAPLLRYDWREIASIYDQELSRVTSSYFEGELALKTHNSSSFPQPSEAPNHFEKGQPGSHLDQ